MDLQIIYDKRNISDSELLTGRLKQFFFLLYTIYYI